MEETYTLEEWIGMLEEVGYDVSERTDPPFSPKDSTLKVQQAGDMAGRFFSIDRPASSGERLSGTTANRNRAADSTAFVNQARSDMANRIGAANAAAANRRSGLRIGENNIEEDEKSSTKKTPYPRPISPTDSSTMVAGAGTNAASVAQRIGYQNTMNRMQSALKAAGKPHRLDFAYEPIPENNYEEPFGENNMKEDTRRTDTLRGAVTSPTTPRPTFSKQGTGGPGSRPTSPTADYGRPHSSRYQSSPVKDTAQMEETYTLEEWIGMVEEAGYSIAEQQPTRGITASPTAKPIVITAPAGPTRNVGGATPTATGRRRTGRTTPRRSPSQAELDQAADAAANQLYSLGSRTQPPRAVRPPASAPQPPETPGDILNRGLANTQQLTARAANAIGDLNTVRSKMGLGPGVTPDDSSKTVAAIDSIGTDAAVRSALNAPRTGIQQVTPAKRSPKNEQNPQGVQRPAAAPNDSVQTASSRDMGLAINKANTQLDRLRIARQGARQNVTQNPDGTFTATVDARQQPRNEQTELNESTVARLQELAGIKVI